MSNYNPNAQPHANPNPHTVTEPKPDGTRLPVVEPKGKDVMKDLAGKPTKPSDSYGKPTHSGDKPADPKQGVSHAGEQKPAVVTAPSGHMGPHSGK